MSTAIYTYYMPRNLPYMPGKFPYHTMGDLKRVCHVYQCWELFNRDFQSFPTRYYHLPTPRQHLAKIVNSRSYQKLEEAIREREECLRSVHMCYFGKVLSLYVFVAYGLVAIGIIH